MTEPGVLLTQVRAWGWGAAAPAALLALCPMLHPPAPLSPAKPVALPPDVPASFSPTALEQAWRLGQNDLAHLLPDARHTIATESDHYIQVEQPDPVIDAVRDVVAAVREPASWHRRREE